MSRLESLADSGELDDDDDDEAEEVVASEVTDESRLNSDELMAEVERFLRDQGNA